MIAGLLQPIKGERKLFNNVNFITWNYDINLLASIKTYFYPKLNFEVFIAKINSNDSCKWVIDNQITIINMNGYFYSKHLGLLYNLDELNSSDVLKKIIVGEYRSPSFVEDAELVKFAWEGNEKVGKIASDKMNVSDNVVVIGYTFPLYNRLTDLKYFNNDTLNNTTLYIQDPNSKTVAEGVKENFGIKKHSESFKSIDDCDSFIIPSNIFKPDTLRYSFA